MPSLMAPVCIVCNTKYDSMEHLGNHMKNIHSESDHSKIERLTETTKATLEQERLNFFENNSLKIFDCSECGQIFPTNNEHRSHIEKYHTLATSRRPQEEVFSDIVTIVPDQDFLTQNTADLKAMLEGIPKEALPYEEDVFEKDFKLVLNSEEKEENSDIMLSYNCNKCKFRAGSKRCLQAHNTFVHSDKFYKCENCPMKTRTELALHYHIDMRHNNYWEVEEEKSEQGEKYGQRIVKSEHNKLEKLEKKKKSKSVLKLNVKRLYLC